MDYYAGMDVSLEASSICVVERRGKIVRERRVASEPEALIGWFRSLGLGVVADRSGGWAVVAMALCGDEGSGPASGIAGDPPCTRRFQSDAGEDRPQRCAGDRPIDASWLVPAGSLQIAAGAGDAGVLTARKLVQSKLATSR